ncbi:MAG: aromatic acid exporter family protein [Oscillospiraceae bacterium]|nr:aromatic acid exporter family protein [Oscillospiraceae bacterium]
MTGTKHINFHIGLRTIKTAAAVMIAMLIVDSYGATTSKLIFAMLGAMEAMQPTFKASVKACLTQIVGVLFGAFIGVGLLALPISHVLAAGIGIVLVITLYNTFHIHFSPSLPCLIVVTLCTTPDILPIAYAFGRIWDSMIGLSVGMAINTLVFPYDNSRQIRATVESLDRELIRFLEEMFDGDDVMPDAQVMTAKVNAMARQLAVFSNQKLLMHRKRQKKEMESFAVCQGKARELLARMEVLSRMDVPGRLNEENRRRLNACGANIRDERPLNSVLERDVVTNYHVAQILKLRRELLEALGK